MATSTQAQEAAAQQELEHSEDARRRSPVRVLVHRLRRLYERICSAVFDSDGDCMRL
jgi:hypothetical protein